MQNIQGSLGLNFSPKPKDIKMASILPETSMSLGSLHVTLIPAGPHYS